LRDHILIGDLTISIGIPIVHSFDSDVFNIGTSPRSWAGYGGFVWAGTPELFHVIWAVVFSPFIFTHNNTVVNFTDGEL